MHREIIDGSDVLWASPKDNLNVTSRSASASTSATATLPTVKGLLFLAHGCGHSNDDWFSKSSEKGCEGCRGLPEERAIVETALELGLVAIAMSSSNWSTKCWNAFDITPVALVLNELGHRFSQAEAEERGATATKSPLPLYAFGASSGGAFVSSLANPLRSRFGIHLDGFVSQIAARLPLQTEEQQEDPNLCKVYITMNRDEETNRRAKLRMRECISVDVDHNNTSTNADSGELESKRCKHIRLTTLPVTPSYFADRIPEISQAESEQMVKVLTEEEYLLPPFGTPVEDPRKSQIWSDALWSASSPLLRFQERGDLLVADKSPIFEVMNVAWGFHEMSRDGVREALAFCFAHRQQLKS